MKFFKINLTSYTDEKTDFMIVPKADEFDGENPAFNEKELLNTPAFKEFVKRTETPVVTVEYVLYEVPTGIDISSLDYSKALQLESDNMLNIIERNDYIIDNIKTAKGKKKKGSEGFSKYLPVVGIFAGAIVLVILSLFVNGNKKANSSPETESSVAEEVPIETSVTTLVTTPDSEPTGSEISVSTTTTTVLSSPAEVTEVVETEIVLDDIAVHFIDVGQGDCVLAQLPGECEVLIDTGTTASADSVIEYLSKLNISDIEYVILSHPHEDHIGGFSEIANNYKIENVIMPELEEEVIPTTNVFMSTVESIDTYKIPLEYASTTATYDISEDCVLEIIAPVNSYSSLNDLSVVCKLTYGETSYLFTGDIEKAAETDIMAVENCDISATVLKISHHGSNSSTTNEFLSAVNPEIAVISVGADNEYEHPNDDVVNRINDNNIELHRTDLEGTIIMKSDGVDVWCEYPSSSGEVTEEERPVYSGTNTTYSAGTYKISFNSNGGNGEISPLHIKAGVDVNLPKDGITRDGYDFIGWNVSSDIKYPLYSYTMPENDIVLYAIWEPKEYTVTYDSNGGLGLVVPYKVKVGEEVPLPVEGIVNGNLVLAGWNTKANAKSALSRYFMPNKNVTMYAVWAEEESQATITLVADGQESTFKHKIGDELNCRDDFGIQKDGYIVSGWTLYDGYGDILNTLTVRGDTTLYATWEEAVYIDITIDQSHINKPNAVVSVALDMNGFAKYKLPVVDTQSNHRKGYTYGWSSTKNGFIEFYGGEIAKFEKPTTVYRVRNMYGGGNGTQKYPYIINNWEHIELMADKGVSGYYKQITDITMPDSYKHKSIKVISPTTATDNYNYDYFVYDGSDYTISNLKSSGGLFDELRGSEVKNLTLSNMQIETTALTGKCVGCIANRAVADTVKVSSNVYTIGNSNIKNCILSNCIINCNNYIEYGGLVIGYGGSIVDTYINNSSINVHKETAKYLGGIAGTAAEITNCGINGLKVEGKNNVMCIGGIVGTGYGFEIQRKNLTNNYLGCDIADVFIRNIAISGAENVGGFMGASGGRTNNPYVTRCYISNSILNGINVGSLIGTNDGQGNMLHTFSFCIVDETNKYENVGKSVSNKSTYILGAQILRVPYEGLMVEGVTYILGDKWIKNGNVNDGYVYPSSLEKSITKCNNSNNINSNIQ